MVVAMQAAPRFLYKVVSAFGLSAARCNMCPTTPGPGADRAYLNGRP